MIAVDLETWVSLAAIAVLAIGLITYLDRKFDKADERIDTFRDDLGRRIDKIDARIDTTRTELIDHIDTTRTELKADNRDLAAAIARLEERTYELAAGRRPKPLIVPPH